MCQRGICVYNHVFVCKCLEGLWSASICVWRVRPLHWRHNGRDGVSNRQTHDCLLNRVFRRKSKKTSKLHVTGLYAGNSPVTGEFPAQMASNAENISIWWRHHVIESVQWNLLYGMTLDQIYIDLSKLHNLPFLYVRGNLRNFEIYFHCYCVLTKISLCHSFFLSCLCYDYDLLY